MAKCKSFTIGFFFLLFFAGFANVLYAATVEVHPGESIQNAINQAAPGDTVFVFSGIYAEDVIMKDGVTLDGDHYARVILKGKVLFKDKPSILKNITILFPESSLLSYSNSQYSDFKIDNDAGITIINSSPVIQNCVIKPDDPPREYYGKAIQIWNLYNPNPDPDLSAISPSIEGVLIQNTECGIYYFSQAFSGKILGQIKNNTFYHNKTAVTFRMHKESPQIYNNIFDASSDTAVYFTYEDGSIFGERKEKINNNLFYKNTRNFWCDESQNPFDLIGIQGNIEDDPRFIGPVNNSFYLQAGSPCINMGQAGEKIGSYSTDLEYPTLTNILPMENKFIGQSKISISGTVHDDNGIFSVYANSEPAAINGTAFTIENFPLDYGLNDINITAKDVAQKDTTVSKAIYNFRMPIAPPEE